MKIVWFFALLGFNALVYSALVGFCFGPDEAFTKHPKLRQVFMPILFVLSFPGVLLFHSASRAHGLRIFDYDLAQKKAVRSVSEKIAKPQKWEAELHGWDVDRFTDSDGHFDLRAWKSHEYSKLGLD